MNCIRMLLFFLNRFDIFLAAGNPEKDDLLQFEEDPVPYNIDKIVALESRHLFRETIAKDQLSGIVYTVGRGDPTRKLYNFTAYPHYSIRFKYTAENKTDPFVVYIYTFNDETKKHRLVGIGSIITPRIVMTSAVLVQKAQLPLYRVLAGVDHTPNNHDPDVDEFGTWRRVTSVKPHRHRADYYDSGELDIALVQVDPDFKFSNSIQPIMLAKTDYHSIGKECIVQPSGFLKSHFLVSNNSSDVEAIQKTTMFVKKNVSVYQYTNCMSKYSRFVPCHLLCAEIDKWNPRCMVIPGSPLICLNQQTKTVLLTGIKVGSNSCGHIGPTVKTIAFYADVGYHNAWIHTTVRLLNTATHVQSTALLTVMFTLHFYPYP